MAIALGSSASTPVRAQGTVDYTWLTPGNVLPLCLTVSPARQRDTPPPGGAVRQQTTGQLRVPVDKLLAFLNSEIQLSDITCEQNEAPVIAILYVSPEWGDVHNLPAAAIGELGGGFPWGEAPFWPPLPDP